MNKKRPIRGLFTGARADQPVIHRELLNVELTTNSVTALSTP
jgi:hypothetical protein